MANPSLGSILGAWYFDPEVMLVVAMTGAIYLAGLRTMQQQGRLGRLMVGPQHILAFAAGLLTIALALLSPIDTLDTRLFTIHMVQHLLLLVVAPPLLLLGKPIPVLLFGLPRPLLRGVVRAYRHYRWLPRLTHVLTFPPVVWILYVGDVVLWHIPALYAITLSNTGIHVMEHLSFLAIGLLSWWVIVEPLPGPARLHPGIRLLYSWATMLPLGLIGLALAAANRPWYQFYALHPRLWDLSALDDQRLGGVIMWVPGCLVYIGAITALFVVMMRDQDVLDGDMRESPHHGYKEPVMRSDR